MPQPTIVKATSPADLLALIPHLVGFEPRESVVFVPFRGNRTHGALRLDLPTSPRAQKGLVTFAIGTLCKLADVDGMAAIIHTDAATSGPLPHRNFAEVAARRIRHAGFALKDVLVQGSDGWASYLDESLRGSLDDIRASAVNDHVPALRPEPEQGTAPPELIAEVEAAIEKVRADMVTLQVDPIDLFEDASGFDELTFVRLAPLLLHLLQVPPVRDAVMLQWASPSYTHELIWETSLPDYEAIDWECEWVGNRMFGIGERPDPDRLEAAIALLHRLLFLAAPSRRPPLLCMLAWLNWALGRGSVAGRCLDEVVAIDPEYSMAHVLGTLIGNGMLPEWAFAEATS